MLSGLVSSEGHDLLRACLQLARSCLLADSASAYLPLVYLFWGLTIIVLGHQQNWIGVHPSGCMFNLIIF